MTLFSKYTYIKLQWRHNERDDVSDHQPHDCLLNRLFKVEIKEHIKVPRHWPLCPGNSPVTDEFPAQRASNGENVSIWWRLIMKLWNIMTDPCSRCDGVLNRPLLQF